MERLSRVQDSIKILRGWSACAARDDGLKPKERQNLTLTPNLLSDWRRIPADAVTGAALTLTLTSFEDPTGKRFGDDLTKIKNLDLENQMRVLENKIEDLEAKLKQADDVGNLPDRTLCAIALEPGQSVSDRGSPFILEATRRGLTADTCQKLLRDQQHPVWRHARRTTEGLMTPDAPRKGAHEARGIS